eukprot:561096-Alexandrium_andersonii.AAC.1
MSASLVGSEMCIRDRTYGMHAALKQTRLHTIGPTPRAYTECQLGWGWAWAHVRSHMGADLGWTNEGAVLSHCCLQTHIRLPPHAGRRPS